MAKSIDDHFCDWESHVFGYGYGTGEPNIIPAIKAFMDRCPPRGPYDYRLLEHAVGPVAAWLLINAFARAELIEYGSSPRYGWLTKEGLALKSYLAERSEDALLGCLNRDEKYINCFPDGCNCGPQGWEAGKSCGNPFWVPRA